MKKCLVLALFLGIVGIANTAQAALIDFTDSIAWGNVQGDNDYTSPITFDGVSVRVKTNYSLTFNSGGDVNAGCSAATGLVCDGDGIGVRDDEVTAGGERLEVLFSSPVTVSAIALLDLFGYPNKSGDVAAEIARWVVYSPSAGSEISTTGIDTSSNLGYRSVLTNYTNVTKIKFYATQPANSDFALASLTISRAVRVAEPATFLLSALGFVAVAAARSRRRRS